jgi:citrate lyase subunit beta/citryl-CoA lyase
VSPEPSKPEGSSDQAATVPPAPVPHPAWQRVQLARHPKRPHALDYIERVFTDFRDSDGLRAESEAARRDGFTGKLAIHPDQIAIINQAFTPSPDDVRHAEQVVAAFEAEPDAGVLSVGGKMVDRPHLVQARRVLERAARE